jgi:hypothetical protein
VDCCNSVACRQRSKRIGPGSKKRIGVYQERAGSLLGQRRKGCIQIRLAADVQGQQLDIKGTRSQLRFPRVVLGVWIVGVGEKGDQAGCRRDLA